MFLVNGTSFFHLGMTVTVSWHSADPEGSGGSLLNECSVQTHKGVVSSSVLKVAHIGDDSE